MNDHIICVKNVHDYAVRQFSPIFYLFFRSATDPVQVSTSQYLGSAEIV